MAAPAAFAVLAGAGPPLVFLRRAAAPRRVPLQSVADPPISGLAVQGLGRVVAPSSSSFVGAPLLLAWRRWRRRWLPLAAPRWVLVQSVADPPGSRLAVKGAGGGVLLWRGLAEEELAPLAAAWRSWRRWLPLASALLLAWRSWRRWLTWLRVAVLQFSPKLGALGPAIQSAQTRKSSRQC